MTTAPQDHKKKTDENVFEFDYQGKTYKFAKPFSVVMNRAWLRKNRHRDEFDMQMTMLETLADDAVLDVLDGMSDEDYKVFGEEFSTALENSTGATPGE